jgi:sugar/nucleoside kinase (ribokinase family)
MTEPAITGETRATSPDVTVVGSANLDLVLPVATLPRPGETVVGDTVFRWKPRDIFVVPSWNAHFHRAATEAVLFSFSDRPVQDVLGLWREERSRA